MGKPTTTSKTINESVFSPNETSTLLPAMKLKKKDANSVNFRQMAKSQVVPRTQETSNKVKPGMSQRLANMKPGDREYLRLLNQNTYRQLKYLGRLPNESASITPGSGHEHLSPAMANANPAQTMTLVQHSSRSG